MSIIEIILLGVGLAMDAVAVSIANGMIYKDITKAGYVSMPVMFGFFQMMMPVAVIAFAYLVSNKRKREKALLKLEETSEVQVELTEEQGSAAGEEMQAASEEIKIEAKE